MKKFLLLLIAAVLMTTAAQAEHLILLHTNDTHSQIDPAPDGKGGILRRKVLIDSVRAAEKNVLLIDAGDCVQSTLYFTLFEGEVEYALMDSLGYDIMILGNHEFDLGMEKLAKYYKNLHAERLSANYGLENSLLAGMFKPYTIKEYDGKKVGFFGINVEPKGMISDKNCEGVVYYDAAAIAESTANKLRNELGCDLVVMISHIGYDDKHGGDLPDDLYIAENSHNIDIIIGGHTHTKIDPSDPEAPRYRVPNLNGKEVLLAQNANQGPTIGYIDIDLDNLTATSKLMKVDKRYDDRIDSSLVAFIAPYKEKVDELMNKPICRSAQFMNHDDRILLMNWTSDLVLDICRKLYTEQPIDLCIVNKGGIRKEMPLGDISEGHINSMFPFENRLVVVRILGKDLIDALEVMAGRGGDAVSKGMYVTYNDRGKITKARLNGKDIKKNRWYTLATIDYLYGGGDYMTPLTKARLLWADDVKYGEHMVAAVKAMGERGEMIRTDEAPRMIKK